MANPASGQFAGERVNEHNLVAAESLDGKQVLVHHDQFADLAGESLLLVQLASERLGGGLPPLNRSAREAEEGLVGRELDQDWYAVDGIIRSQSSTLADSRCSGLGARPKRREGVRQLETLGQVRSRQPLRFATGQHLGRAVWLDVDGPRRR